MSRAVLLLQEVNSSVNAALGDDDFPSGLVETFVDDVCDDLVARGFAQELTTKGTFTFASGQTQQVVPHNLGRTPTAVLLSGQHAEVQTIYVPVAGPISFTAQIPSATTGARPVYFHLD